MTGSDPSAPVPAAGPHGGDAARLAAALGVAPAEVVELSASMNPFAPDVAAIVAGIVTERPEVVGRYPDEHEATASLATVLGVEEEVLVLTNGGAEAIALVAAREQIGDVVAPEFGLYARHLQRVERGAPRWRSNPSNPLGRLAPEEDHARVWDEAFYGLATGTWTRGDAGSWRVGSLTKLWSCPGLRLGYVIAPDAAAADAVRRSRPRWSVNGLALAAVGELLGRTDLPGWAREIAGLRAEFAAQLTGLGFDVEETAANWVLVRRPGLRAALAAQLVAVRDCTSFGLPGVARLALPRREDVPRVLDAFSRVEP